MVPCSICGEWGEILMRLDTSLLRKDVVRRHVSGMLPDKYICESCACRCKDCHHVIIWAQRRVADGLCAKCALK